MSVQTVSIGDGAIGGEGGKGKGDWGKRLKKKIEKQNLCTKSVYKSSGCLLEEVYKSSGGLLDSTPILAAVIR